MIKNLVRWAIALALAFAASAALANFHLFRIQQVYSNADGTLQFVVLQESKNENNEHQWGGQALTASANGVSRQFIFPSDLPSSSTKKKFVLVGTSALFRLGLITPDYVIPDGFLPTGSGQVDFANVDALAWDALPSDGDTALDRTGNSVPNAARNFAGASYSLPVGFVAPAAPTNYEGLWWNSPPASESGWGINFTHQGDTIFATWFTYDLAGKPLWLAMSATKTAPGVYTGDVFVTSGPPFNAVPFSPGAVTETTVGTATITFSDATHATFAYTIDLPTPAALKSAITQTKNIVRQEFAVPVPVCTWNGQPNLANATNSQDLWWNFPASSESGWGINLIHQGDVIFATWFTYDLAGKSWWLAVVANKLRQGVYTGDLFTTTGPPLNAVPFDPATVVETTVGTATFIFNSGNNVTFSYTVNGISQTKTITRQVFAGAGTACQ